MEDLSNWYERNQEWLQNEGESFLNFQRRVDQITSELLGLTYEEFIEKMSRPLI